MAAYVEEIHEFKKPDLYYAATSGLNKTAGSILWISTTAGVGQTTIAWDMYEYAKRVATARRFSFKQMMTRIGATNRCGATRILGLLLATPHRRPAKVRS